MLHPVGPLPAAVYWRRRVLVLLLALSVLGGGGWLGLLGVQRWRATAAAPRPAAATAPLPTPALERVMPSLAVVGLPSSARSSATPPVPTTGPAASALSRSPVPQCTDDMIAVAVSAPASAPAGSRPSLQLVVTDISAGACARDLAAGQREIVLVDSRGSQVWSSADCAPASTGDVRTLAAQQAVSLPVAWDGLTSDPTCAGPRIAPPKGHYVLRGRLGTKKTADVPLTLG